MYAINALLVFGAFFLALFAFVFLAGPLIQTLRLIRGVPLPQAGWMKTAAAVLGAIAVGFVAIVVAEETASSVRAVAAPAAQGVEAAAVNAVSASDELRSAAGRLAPGAGEATGVPASAPRECSPELGVVANCTFN